MLTAIINTPENTICHFNCLLLLFIRNAYRSFLSQNNGISMNRFSGLSFDF